MADKTLTKVALKRSDIPSKGVDGNLGNRSGTSLHVQFKLVVYRVLKNLERNYWQKNISISL